MGWSNRALSRGVYVLALGCALSALTSPAQSAAPAAAALETTTVTLSPRDTLLTLDHNNYSASPDLRTYTWPDNQVASAIAMTFDLSALPAGAIVQHAELRLALVHSDAAADTTYTVTAHKLLGKSAVIAAATGYTADGITSWTANGCCADGIPMAQADISAAYDSAAIDQAPGLKAWDVTTMVQEWLLTPATNRGLLMNADVTKPRDRYRSFASMEHPDASLRPSLRVTYAAADMTPPSVTISAPASGDVLTGAAALEASATDNVAVAAVQFEIDGTPVGPALTGAPYRLNWDTTTVSDGTYTLTASARDSTGNSAPSGGVSVTIENGILILTPEDTSLNLDAVNYSTSTTLATSTWPNNRAASAILMTFDFAALPAGAVVHEATLHLNLVGSDGSADSAYAVAAHKIVGRHALIEGATGYTADGVTNWTPNACCQNGVPLAQGDISAAYDSPAIDKVAGFKTWEVTTLVQEWLLNPATNAGLLLNADASRPGDRYRIFASTEHADTTRRPFLRITYSPAADLLMSALDGSVTGDNLTSEALDPLIEAALAPPATAPISPSGSIATATPMFTWSAVSSATYYLLSITDADPGSPLETWYTPLQAGCAAGIGTCSVAAPRTLTPGGVTWNVLTWNPTGYGPWSATMTAVVEAVDGALVSPVTIGPTGPISTRTPTYSWNPINGVVWYQVSVTDALGISSDFWYTPGQACSSSPCAVTPNVLIATGPAQWRIRAWSAVGASAWTAPVSFDAAGAAPGQATLVAPAGATPSQTPTFTWNALQGVSYYLLRVTDGDSLSVERWYRPSEAGCAVGTGICSVSPGLSVNPGPAEWQILTWNAFGYGPWSDPQPFTVEVADLSILGVAGTPTPISPISSIATSHPTYRWTSHNSATRYRLSIRINGGPATHLWFTRAAAACDAVNCHVQPNITLQTGTAEWQVQMWTANGHGNWSAVVPLSVSIAVPPTPDLVSPNGLISPSPAFVWEPSANAAYYYVRVSDATGLRIDKWFKPEEVGCFSEASNCTLNAAVTLNNGAGSWEALAWNPTGYSPWSPALGFVVSSDAIAPSVAISAPAAGATLSGTVAVSANASDNIGVVGVQFKLDGVNLGTEDTSSPYSVSWNSTTAANGSHTLTAVARDAAGNTTTSAAVTVTVSNDTTAPTVSVSAPAGGTTVSGTISVSANASDNIGVVGVQFKLDGVDLGAEDTTSPYSRSWNTTTAANGNHTLTAVARDAAGNTTTSAVVTVNVSNDPTPPTVSITAPAGGATISGTVSVSANANDNIGVVGVQFKLDGANLGTEDTTSPYGVSWNTTTAANGSHSLTAVARDAAGNTTTSTAVNVTVANALVLSLSPEDTSINLNTTNYSAATTLTTYTWPNQRVANAILMKFNLASLPAGAVVQDATLQLGLVESDATTDATYSVSIHKIVGKNPVLSATTGYTTDGAIAWTANNCCNNNVPMAQADISAAYDTQAINKTLGLKSWSLETMVNEWLADPASNFGLLLNSDATKLADRYRFFASMEHTDPALRPVLRITYTMPPPDPTPPSVSTTAPAGGTTVSGTVTVSANASDNVGVASVQFQVDGANLGAADISAPYSVSWNSTTVANGNHTLRAIARDAAGNTTTSAAVTVTVSNDTTAPTVSISAPAGGATLSGIVTVSGSASDNIGVVGVQFKLDGANLGSEDATSPYSVSWNTTTASNGNHALTAVARDAAGNTTTSGAVAVTVSNGGPPPGGIAALFPGDVGIETHPDVVLAERFDDPLLSTVLGRWTDVLNGTAMSLGSDVPAGSTGSKSLTIPWVGGGVNDGGHLYKQLATGIDDVLYVRYYIKYPTSGTYDHTGIWMGGFNPASAWPNPQAGIKPLGNDRFIAGAEQNQFGRFDHYDYWMNMRQSADGNYWGNLLLNNPSVQATEGQWMCVEHMVKLNDPASSNGEHAIWLNGVKVSHLGPGFPNGSWSGGIFTQSPGGSPFEGFRWRSTSALKLNWIWLQVYAPDDAAGFNGSIKFDHVVAARNYIGCLSAGGPGDVTAPTASLTAPASGATLSGTATVSATASDNVGVVGVQFKLDGANLGAEDTTAPFSISWDTTTAPNGSHTLAAVARDAAGNTATSAGRSVTVSNSSSGSAVFQSNWDTGTGTASNTVTDGGRWPNYWEFNGGSSVQLLSVVSGGVNGHNALRVQQRGSSFAANLQLDNFVPQSNDYYVRYYMKNDDTSSAGDHVVTVDTYEYANLTFMRKMGSGSGWNFVTSFYGCGYTYPIGHWGPTLKLANGAWYRFEYHVDFIDSTHVRVHPRVYDAAGTLVLSAADFRQSDYGGASWNGRSDWTLASYYAAGHSFCVNPGWVNDFGLGNNGQQGAGDTGQYWYFSGVEIRTDTWPGPVAPR